MINQIEKIVCFCLVISMVIFTGLQVFFRYVLNNPLAWTEELARITLVWLVFWGSAIAVRRKKHLSISFLVNRLPRKIRLCIDIFNQFAMMSFLGIAAYTGYQVMLITKSIVTPALGISYLWFYIIVPISCIFMFLQMTFVVIDNIKKIKKGE
ncbi:hypothetical protein ES705_03395 [subsurface metagenome]